MTHEVLIAKGNSIYLFFEKKNKPKPKKKRLFQRKVVYPSAISNQYQQQYDSE